MIRAALSRLFKPKAAAPVEQAPGLTVTEAARAMGKRSAELKRDRARQGLPVKRSRSKQKIIDTALEIRALHNMPEFDFERKDNG